MRDIEFRAYCIFGENKGKVYHNVGISYSDCGMRIELERPMINPDNIPLTLPASHFKLVQYTGLRDKDNKKIFEGDIVKFPEDCDMATDEIGYIVYHGDGFRISFSYHSAEHNVKTGYDESGSFSALWWLLDGQAGHIGHDKVKAEVIGNIYKNPELLEKEKCLIEH